MIPELIDRHLKTDATTAPVMTCLCIGNIDVAITTGNLGDYLITKNVYYHWYNKDLICEMKEKDLTVLNTISLSLDN